MSENPTSAPIDSQDPAVGENIADKPKIPRCGEPMDNPFPKYEGDAWKDVLEHVAEPDRARCKAWKEEVETLLIFAGLFSAVVTAFIIESYKSLREDFGDTSTALLRRIALQLEGNGTATFPPASAFEPSASSIRVNTLWFLSLILSLTTVLIGTLCLQWLREHLRLPSDPRKALQLQHMQAESLDRWYVPHIFTTLPLLLQIAVIIFFVGIVDFLWQLHRIIAAVSLAFIGVAVIFYVVTTIAPTIQDCLLAFPRLSTSQIPRSPCPYRSPQSFLFLQAVAPLVDRFICRCIPMGWIWKLYWSKHDDRGCDRHQQQSIYSAGVAYRTESWISHHTSWLLQRDLDVIFSQDLHWISTWTRLVTALEPHHIHFYDIIKTLLGLVETVSMPESIAPWVCIDEYLRDMASIENWPEMTEDLTIFLQTVRGRQDFGIEDLDYLKKIRADFAFCNLTFSYTPPPNLLRPYWFEKNFRVLGSGVSEVISDNMKTRPLFRQFTNWFKWNGVTLPDTQLSYGHDIIDAILAAPTATWEPKRQIEAADLFCPLFLELARTVASCYSSSPFIQSRHLATLEIATSSIRASTDSAAFLVTMTSYYLISFFCGLHLRNASHSSLASEEETEILSLIRAYRTRHLGVAPKDSTERLTLLAIQTSTVKQVPDYLYKENILPASLKSYFKGMFDTDGDSDLGLDEMRTAFGSFLDRGAYNHSHSHRTGDSGPRPTIIEIAEDSSGTSGQD